MIVCDHAALWHPERRRLDRSWSAPSLQQDDAIACPEWTEYRKKNGLDPLGMQTGSINIYQRLLPGVSNVTLRIRYYGLLARTYAREIGNTDPIHWQRFVRRAEALYALIAQNKGNENGVAGVDWASRTLKQAANGKPIDFAADSEPPISNQYLKKSYLQQAWGAYGAAYGSQLFEIGILAQAGGHAIPVPGDEIGERAADAFAEGLSGLAAPFLAAIRDAAVSRSALDKLAPITPSGIPEISGERSCYEDILFARGGIARPADVERRRSLRLLLAVAKLHSGLPAAADTRWMLYAGCDPGDHPLQLPSDELTAQRWRWWVYQANDLLHVCYEALLRYSLDVLGETPAGIALSRLIGECGKAGQCRREQGRQLERIQAGPPRPAKLPAARRQVRRVLSPARADAKDAAG